MTIEEESIWTELCRDVKFTRGTAERLAKHYEQSRFTSDDMGKSIMLTLSGDVMILINTILDLPEAAGYEYAMDLKGNTEYLRKMVNRLMEFEGMKEGTSRSINMALWDEIKETCRDMEQRCKESFENLTDGTVEAMTLLKNHLRGDLP